MLVLLWEVIFKTNIPLICIVGFLSKIRNKLKEVNPLILVELIKALAWLR